MKLAIMQPYLFPYLGYFQYIHSVDKFIFYDDVAFIMRGWINRNNILLNNSKHLISIPLHKASPNKLIKDVSISSNPDWKDKLLTTLNQAYKKSPYFDNVFPLIESLISRDIDKISELAIESIKLVVHYLEMETEIVESSSIYNNFPLKREFRIVDITLKENAEICIVPWAGRELYDKDFFQNHRIKLYYHKPIIEQYTQFRKHEFVPNLSMIDIMMFNSMDKLREMIRNYELI